MKHVRLYEDHQADRDFIRDLEKIGVQEEIDTTGLALFGKRQNEFNAEKELGFLRKWNDEHETKVVSISGNISYDDDRRKDKSQNGHQLLIQPNGLSVKFSNGHSMGFTFTVVSGGMGSEFRYRGEKVHDAIHPTPISDRYLPELGVFETMFAIFKKFYTAEYNKL